MTRNASLNLTPSEKGAALVVMAVPFIAAALAWTVVAVDAFVLRQLWTWFAVPIFGAPVLTFAGAVGVAVLVRFVAARYPMDIARREVTGWERFLAYVLGYALPLLLGWIVQRYALTA